MIEKTTQAVMAAMSAKGLTRTSPENVQDVLDALAKLAPVDDATLNAILWLYRRLPRAYGRPPFIEHAISDLAGKAGIEVRGFFGERDRGAAADLPARDSSRTAEEQGMFRKFVVYRVDGSDEPGGKHHGCANFVLDLTHDPAAIPAIQAYAAACALTHPVLATELFTLYGIPRELRPSSAERRRELQAAPLPRDAEFALEHAAIALDLAGEADAHAQVTAVIRSHLPLTSCAAARDGDCSHPNCPQARDGEPMATGRHCPLDSLEDRE